MFKKGIWTYSQISELIEPKYHISLGEGGTGINEISFEDQKVCLKREDKNPNQSFKDRSLVFQIAFYLQQGKKRFVISSSGNAAISALSCCQKYNLELDIFVSNKIEDYKLKKITDIIDIKFVHKSKRPKSDAMKFSRKTGAVNLRGSKDEKAVIGFQTIAFELIKQMPNADAVFICCSSGTSTVGIWQGYQVYNFEGIYPQIHIVQTSKIHPIAKEFDTDFKITKSSLAGAVCDRVAHRKLQVLEIIRESNGSGWVVSDQELIIVKKNLSAKGIEIEGYNAYVSFAGLQKALKNGFQFDNPVCIISGI
ncbi:pyridoxal-phosphate dependent enzyme [Candidatus Dojkabacteria bacterium]|nr:pyridoxal-phosphate dependent enzyme [Candidatus Dojkabacteria bacterium]